MKPFDFVVFVSAIVPWRLAFESGSNLYAVGTAIQVTALLYMWHSLPKRSREQTARNDAILKASSKKCWEAVEALRRINPELAEKHAEALRKVDADAAYSQAHPYRWMFKRMIGRGKL